MKTIIAAVALAVLSSQAIAYDFKQAWPTSGSNGASFPKCSVSTKAARYRQMELNDRMQQLEQRDKVERSDNEWRQRQLEADNYRPGWR